MNAAELIITVSNVTGLPRKAVRDVLETASDVVAETLAYQDDQVVSVPGMGKFRPKPRPEREIKVPGGKVVVTPARTGVRFAPSIDFLRRLNGEV